MNLLYNLQQITLKSGDECVEHVQARSSRWTRQNKKKVKGSEVYVKFG